MTHGTFTPAQSEGRQRQPPIVEDGGTEGSRVSVGGKGCEGFVAERAVYLAAELIGIGCLDNQDIADDLHNQSIRGQGYTRGRLAHCFKF